MSEYDGLPVGWAQTTVVELSQLIRGVSYSGDQASKIAQDGLVPILRAGNIQRTLQVDEDLVFVPSHVVSHNQRIKQGDVVLAMSSGSVTSVGRAAQARENWDGAFGAFCGVLRPSEQIDDKFFGLYFQTRAYRQGISALAAGTNINNIRRQHLESLHFSLPPLNEQRRIVAAIEEQFTRLDAGVAGLERVKANLRRYRASVLKAAVEGKLTEEWRAEHPDAEPASVLLERIQQERRRKWEETELAKFEKAGKSPPKGWQAQYTAPTAVDTSGQPELPKGWTWVAVAQLVHVGTGATPLRGRPDYYEGGTIPWVTSGAVNRSLITEAEQYITEKALAETNAKVFPSGTLLLAMYGEGQTRGKVSELLLDAATNQACAALVFSAASEACRPYLKSYLLSNYYAIRRLSSGGVQPNLNLSIVRKTLVALPPLAEQQAVFAEVERRLSVIEHAEAQMEADIKRAARLRQSILKRAFEGKLVPQDPSDEPADVLLERIKQDQAEQNAMSRNRRRSKRQPMMESLFTHAGLAEESD